MLWICGECTTAYSAGAPRCPHCGSRVYAEQGAEPGETGPFAEPDVAVPEDE